VTRASGGDEAASSDHLYLGLDLGTSGLKGIALDASGEVVARGSASYPTSRPAAGAAEQEPGDWIAAIGQVAVQLAVDAPPRRWRAIGLSAMIPTLVTADAGGQPVGSAIIWEDSRADEQADRLREAFGAAAGAPGGEALYAVTGQWVDGRYLLPMFLRLIAAEPGRAAATESLLAAKDYLFGWLTGRVGTDPSTATGFGCFGLETGRWDQGMLAACAAAAGPDRRLPALPPVLPSAATRPLRAEVAARLGCGQVPVCLGAADSVLGALGLGVRAPGQIAYVAGTSTVILGVASKPLLDPRHRFLVTPLAEPGLWGLEMDLLATGSAMRWLAGLLRDGLDEAALIALAAGTDPAAAPVVLPYLSPGEQGALWDPALSGTITGLTLGHGRRHLARGLVTGILLESRRCLAVLDEAGPFGRDLLVAGGSAAAASFRADLADATGRRVLAPGGPDTDFSARGAALLAAHATGQPRPAAQAPGQPPPAAQATGQPRPAGREPAAVVSEPDPGRAETWSALWAAHERARKAISG